MTEAEKTHSYKKETALTKPRVVIIGGGFGGLCAARGLVGAPVSVTLIDKRNYHLFRPMLYQVATGLLSADQISRPLRSILSRQANVEVLMDEVSGVDTDKRLVRLKEHSISYDYLVLATGIQYNYFGHDEWRRVAPGLESLDDADLIRGKILLAFERAEEIAALDHADTESIRQLLTFVLVGAGTVGVEMASTLAEMSRMALAHDFRHIDPRDAQILLYEAAPRVLPTFPEDLSAKAQRHLESLGVKIYTNTRVTSVDADGVVAGGQRVRSSTVLWGAGVLASPAGRWLGAAKAGLTLRPTELIIFGKARGGTPLMQSAQTVGIDLPLKALVWQDAAGKTWLSHNEPGWIARRHNVAQAESVVNSMDALLGTIAREAADAR